MPQRKRRPTRGPTDVGLLALHDREFFERLVKDPRAAMEQKVAEGKLKLTDADKDEVERLIRDRNRNPIRDPGAVWDNYKKTGRLSPEDWMEGWAAELWKR